MLKGKVFKIFLLILMLIGCLSFSGLALAQESCPFPGSGQGAPQGILQGIPTVTSNPKYLPGWNSESQQFTLPSTGQEVYTPFIPSGASVNVRISGVISFWEGISNGADAAYLLEVPPSNQHYPITDPVRSLNITTGNGPYDPQPPLFWSDHIYDWTTDGKGQEISLRVDDINYEDNIGSFTVTVSW